MEISEIYKNAYYDLIYEGLSATPPNYEMIIDILGEIKERLMKMLKVGSPLHCEIDEKIDLKFIRQMITNDAFSQSDFLELVCYIFKKCKQLGTPARDEFVDYKLNEIHKLSKKESFPTVVVFFIRNVNDIIDNIYFDMHEFLNS